MMDALLMPLQFAFMTKALLIAALLAVPTALLSCFLVLKGWALMGDAMSHGVFPGVVLAYMAGMPLALGAFGAGMICALGIGFLAANSRIKQDTVMGIVFSGMFGLGLLLYVSISTEVHLDHILFGDMLGVGQRDIIETAAVALLTVLVLIIKWKDFLLHAFDPVQARAVGLKVTWLHYGLLCLLTLTIVAALKSVGILLAIAMLIAPGATALLLTCRFGLMLLWAVLAAVCASLAGVYLSFFIDSAPAPTIVLLMMLQFLLALAVCGRRPGVKGAAGQ
ncbi:iron transmembrane ABC transporter component [Oceanimonas sp. GK1]|uniref:metal ABC transporter permease n=1 Tax=Oceanimonas sp. (strain GK1 / IBRC-M 10197) TaxID=511062 RepID=UPI0002494A51|nr:metal ABC transporter permease [Oceanimonas sp. GK1]AEY00161.1 iron transmembrane ABC transporter component [Oceanimonas sp. GK1]